MSFQIDRLKLAVVRATEEKRKLADKLAKLGADFGSLKTAHDYYKAKWDEADIFEHWLLQDRPATYSLFTQTRIEYYREYVEKKATKNKK